VQAFADGNLRAMMTQQQIDFGLKARVDLSVKEALHHGGYVVTAERETMEQFFDEGRTRKVTAPVWKPHSMWNCYPDHSPAVIAENLYYQGTMFIVSYLPQQKLSELKGDGYWPSQIKKVPKRENKLQGEEMTKDVEIVTYYGDVYIPRRADEDIFLPNMKCQLANGVLIYAKENDTPYQPVIYRGWERMDVRDPYYTSPIIKMSPFQKIGSVAASRFVDKVDLQTDPPIGYDANDPDMIQNGGPPWYPGAKIPMRSAASVKVLEVGDATAPMAGLTMAVEHMQKGLAISPFKSGAGIGDRASAYEARAAEQGGEVRTVHFIDQVTEALRSFLYMQHSLNLKQRDFGYEYYNPEMNAPDFMFASSKDLPSNVHFEVVGARGILGEQERSQKMTAVTAFASSNPLFAPLIQKAAPKILIQMYQDAGVKNAENFLGFEPGQDPVAQAKIAQLTQMVQKLAQELKEAQLGNQVKMGKAMMDNQTKREKIAADTKVKLTKILLDNEVADKDRAAEIAGMLLEAMDGAADRAAAREQAQASAQGAEA
jgi:hypothetical protein